MSDIRCPVKPAAYQKGYAAASNNKIIEDNPYTDLDSRQKGSYYHWRTGFRDYHKLVKENLWIKLATG